VSIPAGCIDFGDVGTDSEFFVMRLKDLFAPGGLRGYSGAVRSHAGRCEDAGEGDDAEGWYEYSRDIDELYVRSNTQIRKVPD